MNETPTTVEEWARYVNGLSGSDLRSKAINANTQAFVRTLLGEGYSMPDVKSIVMLFGERLKEEGQLLPRRGVAFDW